MIKSIYEKIDFSRSHKGHYHFLNGIYDFFYIIFHFSLFIHIKVLR